MNTPCSFLFVSIVATTLTGFAFNQVEAVVHDAEYYILKAQHGDEWAAEDKELDAKLAELERKHGAPPNIIHIMWDDTSFGDVGIPAISKIRGFNTPNINKLASEGILFTRMYTEPSCTPSRAACMTGQHPVRNGMYKVDFPIAYHGMRGEEVTIAEVLSKAGYATGFYGKWHLGDIEQSYPHNQGFDESLFCLYNQIVSVWNRKAEAANAILGLYPDQLPPNPYRKDLRFIPNGWIMTMEGKKGGETREFGGTTNEDYDNIDKESMKRTLDFIRRNAKAKKPFYACYWPMLVNFMPKPEKVSLSRALYPDAMEGDFDPFVGQVMEELKQLGIADNTIVVVMADNGPMSHNPPPGLAMTETIFRGGKGDFTEGGVRVPAFAWWPGVIEPGQIVGDIVHQTDLYMTFARLGKATANIPTDRIIDGIDQTALFLKGDTHSRRDYVHIYAGPELGATVKGEFKRHWITGDAGDKSGVAAAYYNILHDTREHNPLMVHVFHLQEEFNRMRARHELMKRKFPDHEEAHGVPYTGLSNARPETKALWKEPPSLKELPFSLEDVIEFDLPWDDLDIGQSVRDN